MSSLRLTPLAFALVLTLPLAACGAKVTPDSTGTDGGIDGGSDTGGSGDASPIDSAPTTCDGASGARCGLGMYCHHADGTCGEGSGTCEVRTDACGKNYQPMCGCDGVTYGNPCLAAAAGMSILYSGPCVLTGTRCGGGEPPTCGKDEFCHFPDGNCAPGASGTCEKKPSGCPDIYAPVCGCDGKSFPNACEAMMASEPIAFPGECAVPPIGKSCGGFVGATCEKGEYCDYPDSYCGAADGSGTCSPRPEVCDGVYDPVCCCDGKTYSSPCAAHAVGMDDATKGPCSK